MKIHVEALKLPVSQDPEDRIGDIRLRLYQSQLRHCNERRVLLRAPTSSGKTLAYLIRAIEARGIESRFKTTIIIYPTNALTWDQAHSLHTLLTQKIGKKTNLTVESDENAQWRTEDANAEIDLYVLNGETLATLSQESKSSEGKALIEQLRRNQAEARIILTNPEILYYMFLYKFAKMEDLIDLVFNIKTPNLLIFDEFHLYHGYSLATITYMLVYMKKYFDQIIFSSATPIEVKSIIHEKYQEISAQPSVEGDTVRHPIELAIEGARGILSLNDVPNVKRLVDKYYESYRNSTKTVKVLIILSSVMTCLKLQEELEKSYPNEVTAIHGLVPSRLRPRTRSEFKSIVLGTSAIEVGVDFDTSSLILESHDYSTFIQRLGRGARHDSCCATAFLPELYLPLLKEDIREDEHITPDRLDSCIRLSLPNLPSYSSFPVSSQAAPILLAVLMNWVIKRPAGTRLNEGEIVQQTMRQLEDGSLMIPVELKQLEGELLRICKESPKGDILMMAKRMSCRSSLDSIPAVFNVGGTTYFDELSLFELSRLHFRLVTNESLKERKIKVPWKMRHHQEFVEVYGTRERQSRARIAVPPGRFDTAPEPLIKFQVLDEDNDVEEKLAQILKKQPAYILPNKGDWRLPGFYTTGGDFLVVGGDAYLAWFIKELENKND